MAFALFAARPNSHPFQERQLSLKEPIKIGRAVAKAKSSQNNGIFDCKVLSRNHALMWYENGKFMLQDTKSSNGTYVNSVRLSRGSEESDPCEIKSGDVLQFGVEVVENSKNVTHGCIVGLVTLFHEDGSEATGTQEDLSRGVISFLADKTIQPQEMWQLSQFLQDALHREQMLENKLATLQRMIANSHVASDDTFQGFIQEDKLLSRLESLENQLEIVCKDLTEEDVQTALLKMQDDRYKYEIVAKGKVENILKEKHEVVQKYSDIERHLSNSEDECSHLRAVTQKQQQELQSLIEKYNQRTHELQALNEQISEARILHDAALQQDESEMKELKLQLEDAERRGSALAVEVESLQAECDFTKKQLNAMKSKLLQHQQSSHLTVDEDSLDTEEFRKSTEDLPFASDHATLEKDLKNKSVYIKTLKQQIVELQSKLNRERQGDTCLEDQESDDAKLPYLLHQSQDLEAYEECRLASDSWHTAVDRPKDISHLCLDDQFQTLKDVLLSNKILLELINEDLHTLMVKANKDNKQSDDDKDNRLTQLEMELTTAYSQLEDVRNELLNLGDQLTEEQDGSKKAKELAATLEHTLLQHEWKKKLFTVKTSAVIDQLYEAQRHMNLEALDKSLSYSSLESARRLATEMQKQAMEYSKAARCEKLESINILEENETLKMRINRLENEVKRLKQENRLLDGMETPRNTQSLESNQNRSKRRNKSRRDIEVEGDGEDITTEDGAQILSVDDLQEQLELAKQSLTTLSHEKELQAELHASSHSQLLNIVFFLFLLLVGFGGMLMLGVINVTSGTLPLLDERTWTEIWEHLF